LYNAVVLIVADCCNLDKFSCWEVEKEISSSFATSNQLYGRCMGKGLGWGHSLVDNILGLEPFRPKPLSCTTPSPISNSDIKRRGGGCKQSLLAVHPGKY